MSIDIQLIDTIIEKTIQFNVNIDILNMVLIDNNFWNESRHATCNFKDESIRKGTRLNGIPRIEAAIWENTSKVEETQKVGCIPNMGYGTQPNIGFGII